MTKKIPVNSSFESSSAALEHLEKVEIAPLHGQEMYPVGLEPTDLTMQDYLDAEITAGGNYPMNFSANVSIRRFKPVSPDARPLTLPDIRQMAPATFRRLLAAQRAFELMRDGFSSLDMLKDSAQHLQKLLGHNTTSQRCSAKSSLT